MKVEQPTIRDHFVELFLRVAGSASAPTAQRKSRSSMERHRPVHGHKRKRLRKSVAAGNGNVSSELVQRSGGPVLMDAKPEQTRQRNADRAFLERLVQTTTSTQGVDMLVQRSPSRRGSLALIFWRGIEDSALPQPFSLFRLYRHILVDLLDRETRAQGFRPLLLTPAIIDYDRWLGENVVRSPLRDQMEVMDRISRHPSGPAVHGYFDTTRCGRCI